MFKDLLDTFVWKHFSLNLHCLILVCDNNFISFLRCLRYFYLYSHFIATTPFTLL